MNADDIESVITSLRRIAFALENIENKLGEAEYNHAMKLESARDRGGCGTCGR